MGDEDPEEAKDGGAMTWEGSTSSPRNRRAVVRLIWFDTYEATTNRLPSLVCRTRRAELVTVDWVWLTVLSRFVVAVK